MQWKLGCHEYAVQEQMAIAHRVREMKCEQASVLPGMIKGLRLAAKRPIDPRRLAGRRLIQASAFLLKTLGYEPIQRYEFDQYHIGPSSNRLGREIDHLDGTTLRSAVPDKTIAQYLLLVEALKRGDSFVMTLSCAVDFREGNPKCSTQSLMEFHAECNPSQTSWINEAWAFMEEKAWPNMSR
jgi:hypothetical protein